MAKRTNVPELITFLIFLELVAFLAIDSIFAFGFISYFETEIDRVELIYLRTDDCAGCDIGKLDALVSELERLPAVTVMKFNEPDASTLARANMRTYPSLSLSYKQYNSRADISSAIEKSLTTSEKSLTGGVLFGSRVIVLTVPFTFPYPSCGESDKVVLDYFHSDDVHSNANEGTLSMLRAAFGNSLEVRLHQPDSPEAGKYEILAVPSYIFNCKYKKIGTAAAEEGTEAEFSSVSEIICHLLEEKPEICS